MTDRLHPGMPDWTKSSIPAIDRNKWVEGLKKFSDNWQGFLQGELRNELWDPALDFLAGKAQMDLLDPHYTLGFLVTRHVLRQEDPRLVLTSIHQVQQFLNIKRQESRMHITQGGEDYAALMAFTEMLYEQGIDELFFGIQDRYDSDTYNTPGALIDERTDQFEQFTRGMADMYELAKTPAPVSAFAKAFEQALKSGGN